MLYARLLLSGALVLCAAGCATYNTSILVWPGLDRLDKGVHSDHIYEVVAGYRDRSGNVVVCVRGAPAGRAWWLGDTEFSLTVAHGILAAQPGATSLRRGSWARSSYAPPAENIRSYCPPRLAGADDYSVLPITRLKPQDFGRRAVDDMPKDKVRAIFHGEGSRPALYVISGQWLEGSTVETLVIVYVHDSVVARESPALEIDTQPRQVGSQPGWLLALPFAVAFDILTSPIQLLAILTGH